MTYATFLPCTGFDAGAAAELPCGAAEGAAALLAVLLPQPASNETAMVAASTKLITFLEFLINAFSSFV